MSESHRYTGISILTGVTGTEFLDMNYYKGLSENSLKISNIKLNQMSDKITP